MQTQVREWQFAKFKMNVSILILAISSVAFMYPSLLLCFMFIYIVSVTNVISQVPDNAKTKLWLNKTWGIVPLFGLIDFFNNPTILQIASKYLPGQNTVIYTSKSKIPVYNHQF